MINFDYYCASCTHLHLLCLLTLLLASMGSEWSEARTTLQLICLPCFPQFLPTKLLPLIMLSSAWLFTDISSAIWPLSCIRDIDALEQQNQAFCEVVSHEQWRKHEMEAIDSQTSFFNSWKILYGLFPELESFCGGHASVFPGMSQVESDFSIVKVGKDVECLICLW